MPKRIPTPEFSQRHLTHRLRRLIGTWRLDGIFTGGKEEMTERGTVSFRWLVKDALVVVRSNTRVAPKSVAVIGADDTFNAFTMMYCDARDVVRRYEMTLDARRWTLRRKQRGFQQRFVGRFSRNGRKIVATWEKSADGRRWMKDFDLTYTRVRR
jgi:hypothetical protein